MSSSSDEASIDPIIAQGTMAPGSLVVDNEFQFELVYFQVENTLFTAIKQWFSVKGSPFHDMFSIPGGTLPRSPESEELSDRTTGAEGESPRNPIVLEQTKATHFKSFLRALYPLCKISSYDECIGVLHLSTRWNFNKVRGEAITALTQLLLADPAERIRLGEKYFVQDWLRSGLVDVVTKTITENLHPDDLSRPSMSLDYETIAKVFYVCHQCPKCQCDTSGRRIMYPREHVARCTTCQLPPGNQAPSTAALETLVQQVFRARLEASVYVPHDASLSPNTAHQIGPHVYS